MNVSQSWQFRISLPMYACWKRTVVCGEEFCSGFHLFSCPYYLGLPLTLCWFLYIINLVWWRYRVDSSWSLCGSHSSTTQCILNAYPVECTLSTPGDMKASWKDLALLKTTFIWVREALWDMDGFRTMENPTSTCILYLKTFYLLLTGLIVCLWGRI